MTGGESGIAGAAVVDCTGLEVLDLSGSRIKTWPFAPAATCTQLQRPSAGQRGLPYGFKHINTTYPGAQSIKVGPTFGALWFESPARGPPSTSPLHVQRLDLSDNFLQEVPEKLGLVTVFYGCVDH